MARSAVLGLASLLWVSAACRDAVDFSGTWLGRAEWVVDGERSDVRLRFVLLESPEGVQGTIHWGDLERTVTRAVREGPELELESVQPTSSIRFTGLYRNEAIQGRFAIVYSADPEPYPGSFRVEREP